MALKRRLYYSFALPIAKRSDQVTCNQLIDLLFSPRRDLGAGTSSTATASNSAAAQPPPWSPDDPEYYNDLPGKVPPDVGPPPVPPLPNYQAPAGTVPQSSAGTLKKAASDRSRPAVDLSDNLIDLNADVSQMARPDAVVASSSAASSTGTAGLMAGAAALPPPFSDHEYVNGIMGSSSDFKNTPANKDPFDMRKR